MTDHSNPITDILVKAITDFVIMESKGTADTENVKARIGTAAQALYEAVKGCVPEVPKGMDLAAFKRVVKSGGLHPNSTKYQSYKSEATMVEIAKAYRNETLTNLSLLFGVDLGSSQDQKQLKAQGHEADNSSEEANP